MRIITVGAFALFWVQVTLGIGVHIMQSPAAADFASYYFAARVAADQGNPYNDLALERRARIDGYGAWVAPYLYPPLFVELMIPLSLLDLKTARVCWWMISTFALYLAFVLLQAGLDPPATPLERTALAVILATFWPIGNSLFMGQVNEVVLLALAAWLALRARTPRAAIFLGIAIAIKMSPAFLVLFLLVQRRWKEASIAVGSAAALVVGSALILNSNGLFFFKEVLGTFLPGQAYHGLRVPLDLPGNHSLGALAYQIAGDPAPGHLRLKLAGTLFHAGAAAALVSWWAWRSWKGLPWEASLAAAVMLMVILPSYTYEHHLVFLLLPAVLLARLASRGHLPPRLLVPGAIAYALLCVSDAQFGTLLAIVREVPVLPSLVHLPKLFPILFFFFVCTAIATRKERGPADTALEPSGV